MSVRDALQLAMRTLWEVKTDNFDTYKDALEEADPNLEGLIVVMDWC